MVANLLLFPFPIKPISFKSGNATIILAHMVWFDHKGHQWWMQSFRDESSKLSETPWTHAPLVASCRPHTFIHSGQNKRPVQSRVTEGGRPIWSLEMGESDIRNSSTDRRCWRGFRLESKKQGFRLVLHEKEPIASPKLNLCVSVRYHGYLRSPLLSLALLERNGYSDISLAQVYIRGLSPLQL